MLPSINSLVAAYTMLITPPKLIGRVVAASGVPGMILMPLGSYFGGVLFVELGAQITLQIVAVLAFASIVPLWLSRQLRQLPLLNQIKKAEGEFQSDAGV